MQNHADSNLCSPVASPWCALYTRHQHEKLAARILSEKGFEVFLPLQTAIHKWSDRVKKLDVPLFPSYVFLKGGLERRLQIVTTPGILWFVGTGGRAGVIPNEEIEAIRRAVQSCPMVEPFPFVRCGDWVRVKSGPLEGIEGVLVRKKNGFRLVLSVEMLQKSAAVEIDAFSVERVPRRSNQPQPSANLSARGHYGQNPRGRIDPLRY
ncbi:MAG TPA: UpxY family transcription antiterminator [Terriglobia bacterium]|nr:UpxY family transcription antiterminator [Terriglobia bacterium]